MVEHSLTNDQLKRHSWADLVEGYLQACLDDIRAARSSSFTNVQSRFLKERAAAAVYSAYVETAQTIYDRLMPAPERSRWKLLDKTENLILVEIPGELAHPSCDYIPFITTRLRLERGDDEWRIAAILEPCFGCNWSSRVIVGQCYLCNGSGEPSNPDDRKCKRCNGTGRCDDCIDEYMLGWRLAGCLRSRTKLRVQYDEP